MSNKNPFPETTEKSFLRDRIYIDHILSLEKDLERQLVYFGLPSGEMEDVVRWNNSLQKIIAVERDEDVSLKMRTKAGRIGIRDKIIILDLDMSDVSRYLGMKSPIFRSESQNLLSETANKLKRVRNTKIDVANLDYYGGFLYPTDDDENKHSETLKDLVEHQREFGGKFLVILTFQSRDTGASEYDRFIRQTIDRMDITKDNSEELINYYTEEGYCEVPIHLRRMIFSVPIYSLKISFDYFRVNLLKSISYKNFYSTVLQFYPRKEKGALGSWPPSSEIKNILSKSTYRVDTKNGNLTFSEIQEYPPVGF